MDNTTRKEIIDSLGNAQGLAMDLIHAAKGVPFERMLVSSLESRLAEFQRLTRKLEIEQCAIEQEEAELKSEQYALEQEATHRTEKMMEEACGH